MLRKSSNNIGNALLGLITVFALAAIVGITSWTSLKKTSVLPKAATSCIGILDPTNCKNTLGCNSQSVSCQTYYNQRNLCPSENCITGVSTSSCSQFTNTTDCEAHRGPGSVTQSGEVGCSTILKSYCTANDQSSTYYKTYCGSLGKTGCLDRPIRCQWIENQFDYCKGEYITGITCTQMSGKPQPSTCMACSVIGSPNSVQCSPDRTKIIQFAANGCTYTTLTNCSSLGKTCNPPNTYNPSGPFCQ